MAYIRHHSVDQTSDEKTNHNPLLASYVKYMFTNVKGTSVLVFEQICRLYLKLLQSNVRLHIFSILWFL